jgi:hypothetical protein
MAASRVRQDGPVQVGDEIEVVSRYRVSATGAGAERLDSFGNFEGEFAATLRADLIKSSTKINGYLSQDDREALWRQKQGAA